MFWLSACGESMDSRTIGILKIACIRRGRPHTSIDVRLVGSTLIGTVTYRTIAMLIAASALAQRGRFITTSTEVLQGEFTLPTLGAL